jgi:hypothetical protein
LQIEPGAHLLGDALKRVGQIHEFDAGVMGRFTNIVMAGEMKRKICAGRSIPSQRHTMLTIRPTKMLARRLGIVLPDAPPLVTNPEKSYAD